jgi:hypothetical protein
MSQTGTSAWWTDVQHLRDAAERTDEARRRADQADLAERRERRERRQVEAEVAPVRRLEAEAQAPRRRNRADGAAPRRADGAAPRRADGAAPRRADVAPVPRRGGYGDAVALPGRRTVEIRGRTVPAPAVPRSLELDRTRRPSRRAVQRVGPRPDRLAMWALLMGLVLILVALSTSAPT